jgi:2-hydroxychromene-2-carboxylate isomerase
VSTLRIYVDFKSAPAYLAMQPTLALLDRLGLTAEWRPFDTRHLAIPEPKAEETRGETHIRVRAQQRRDTNLKYAAVQGIPMVYPATPGATRCALAALLYVHDRPLPFIRAAFTAYWRDGLDLDDAAVVAGLLDAAGYASAGFAAGEFADMMDAGQAEAEEVGVFDTPMFVLDEQLFLGREQLPWIEFLGQFT